VAARRVWSLGSSVATVERCTAESRLTVGGEASGYDAVLGAWVAAGVIESSNDRAKVGQ